MALSFTQPFPTISSPPPLSTKSRQSALRPHEPRISHVNLTLWGPERDAARASRFQEDSDSPWKRARPHSRPETLDTDYNGWSSDFLELCNAQLQLLVSTVSNLAQVSLFFRHENPETGALEFIPLIVHSSDSDDRASRIWISSGSAGQTELEDTHASRVLPGGIPATWILPDYPFKTIGTEGGIVMPDGGLCIPVEYNNVLAGSIVLMPQTAPLPTESQDPLNPWSPEDIKRADMVAKSIALAAALEGKWRANETLLGTSRHMIESVRSLLRTTLHQIRSPISALVTFGHLLLRKLPPGDANRDLAKNMILEALRVDELLEPLDHARDTLVLPEAPLPLPLTARDKSKKSKAQLNAEATETTDEASRAGAFPPVDIASSRQPNPSQFSRGGKQLLWLADVLIPLANMFSVLAREKGIELVVEIDEDTPAVITVEKFVREAVSNLMDNALKYADPGAFIGIKSLYKAKSGRGRNAKEAVEVVVWDTGPGFSKSEVDKVWDFGFRGSAAARKDVPGSGLGLSIVKELLNASGAVITLRSPLPSRLDPRGKASRERRGARGCAFFLYFDVPSR